MTASSTDVQDELRQLMRRFLADTSSVAHLRRLLDSGQDHDPRVWQQLAELGMTGLAVPEDYGGEGMAAADLGVVLEEMGRVLYRGPYFATAVLATYALTLADDEAARERWLPRLVKGELTATLVLTDTPETVATRSGNGWLLSGTCPFVLDGHSGGLVLLTAQLDGGPGLFAVERPAAGVVSTPLDPLDLARPLARVEFHATPATWLDVTDVGAWSTAVRNRAEVALAAEQIGGAQRCLDLAVEYAQTREQFDRPIGSFQAIKHTCANLLVEIESARSAVRHAESVETGPEAAIAAVVARTAASEAYTHAAKAGLQIHGGIGFTWEHDAHLFLRRAKSSELLLGSPREGRRRLADLIGV